MRRRENTFRIDYANVPKKPTFEELHDFIGTVLGMTQEQVKRIQCSRTLGCAFVTVHELSVAQKIVEEHDGKHEIEADGKIFRLKLQMEDGAVEVKIFDLSIDITNEKIADFLSDYGEVISVQEQLWGEQYLFGGCPTGVRVARMLVKRNIPSYVTIDGEMTNISYYGQRITCKHCSEFTHSGISCIQNKKLVMQKLAADQSYANVARRSAAAKSAPKQTPPSEPPTNTQQSSSSPTATPAVKESPWRIVKHKSKPLSVQALENRSGSLSSANTPNTAPPFKTPQDPLPLATVVGGGVPPLSNRKHDGGETDDSTSSSSSRRTRRTGKKMRPDDNEAIAVDDLEL